MPLLTPCFPSKTASALRPLALAALAALATQCQPSAPAEQPAQLTAAPDSPSLKKRVVASFPKFDTDKHILRQLALLPAAERQIAPAAMRRYQLLTRRFWLAEYSTQYLLKQAQTAAPLDTALFAGQAAFVQSHWRVLRGGLDQRPPLPPTMTSHLARMRQVATYQQAALADLQADCVAQRPPRPDATTLAAQQAVAKLLAPLQREPGPLEVKVDVK